MTRPATTLGRGMRALLLLCGPMNVVGAIAFAPPVTEFRAAVGLPEAHPFYLWVLACWIAAFGAAYFHAGWMGTANRAVLAVVSTTQLRRADHR